VPHSHLRSEETDAWDRGVALATEHLALRPPEGAWISVSLNRYPERTSWKMCVTCHGDWKSCPH